ncbi:hypothetical protein AERO9A_250077 [Aeromonas salmonicida]|nr:hypothetical protein AERO9A_250077 [Aeromonas salmonicida]
MINLFVLEKQVKKSLFNPFLLNYICIMILTLQKEGTLWTLTVRHLPGPPWARWNGKKRFVLTAPTGAGSS